MKTLIISMFVWRSVTSIFTKGFGQFILSRWVRDNIDCRLLLIDSFLNGKIKMIYFLDGLTDYLARTTG